MYYGYKFKYHELMLLNKWGNGLVVFETLEDLHKHVNDSDSQDIHKIEIVEFSKLWGSYSRDKGWHSEHSHDRKGSIKVNLFESQQEAERCCPKGYEVDEFRENITMTESTESMNPLKNFLQSHLTSAVRQLGWDFEQAKEYTVSHPTVCASGSSLRSLTITPPRSAEELVQRALDKCNFNEDFLFDYIPLEAGQDAKFPLDFYGVDSAEAFIIPREGHIPERCIEGDEEVFVPTFKVGNAIDWSLDYKRDRRTDVLTHAVKLFAQGYIDKMISEQNRMIGVATSNMPVGKGEGVRSAVSDMITKMKKQRRELTDVFVSPEAFSNLTDAFENSTAAAKCAGWDHDKCVLRGVKVHVETDRVDEMEEIYYTSQDTDSKSNRWRDKKETVWQKLTRWIKFAPKTQEFIMCRKPLVFGFDKRDNHNDSLVMPFRNDSGSIFNDPALTRRQKEGIYGWLEVGCAALNNKAVTVEAYAPGVEQINNTRFVETKLSRVAAFTLPVERSGGWKGWMNRWW